MNDYTGLSVDKPSQSGKNPWIQGIRGICVLAVLAFHYLPQSFKYGFLGVDGFFALSGFLLLPKLINVIFNSKTPVKNSLTFVKQRVQRLFPAFQVFLTLSLITVFLFGHPENLRDALGMSATGLLGIANLGAYRFTGDYFSPSVNPLIHIWSLSAELQCYMASVLIMFLLSRILREKISRALVAIVYALLVLNCALLIDPRIYGLVGFSNGVAFSYYSPFFRLLEFLIGGLFSLKFKSRLEQAPLHALGVIFLLISVIAPGPVSIGLVASFVVGKIVNLTLTIRKESRFARPAIWIGDRSYSIYLYHLPVMYLSNIYTSGIIKLIASFSLTIFLGSLSYAKIEIQPKRKSLRFILNLQITAFAVIVVLGFISENSYFGMLKSISAPPYSGRSEVQKNSFMNKYCRSYSPCLPEGREINHKTLLLIGDSHGEMLSSTLANLSGLHGFDLQIWTSPGCRLILHPVSRDFGSDACAKRNRALFSYIESHHPKKIVLSQAVYQDSDLKEMKASLQRLVRFDIPIDLIGAIPNFPDSQRFMKIPPLISWGVNFDKTVKKVDMDFSNERSTLEFERYAGTLGIKVIKTTNKFCDDTKCTRYKNGKWLYFDNSHLSIYGSQYLKDYLNLQIF